MNRVLGILTKALLLGAACGLPGCGALSDEADQPNQSSVHMEISVELQDMHRCSMISPEIRVFNAPKGTTVYDVRLLEINGQEEKSLGGGSWPEDGSGIIPEGAFTGRYRGPCPPDGLSHKYTFIVAARRGDDVQPLAVRLFNFELE
ncbi:MAG: MbtF [Desulfovibrio sp.]|nr:MbtF [Desulfovibrio sp.]